MGIKAAKPTTPGRRQMTFITGDGVAKKKPEKSLVWIKKRWGGRNNQGKITVRHRGGGSKRFIRNVDFKRDKFDIPARVASIEYDPNRGARLALLVYADGAKRYIIAPNGLAAGATVVSSRNQVEVKPGNAMPLKYILPGIDVCNIELEPGQGGRLVRGAGNAAQVMGVEGDFAQIKLPSGEIRLVKKEGICVIGQVSNPDRRLLSLGKAGRTRHLGIRPTVRGKAMNPIDHPHGGGEGNQPTGLKHPKTPWGKPALGVKTRKRGLSSDRLIIQRREKK